ncbi:MAG: hypothetical protein DRP10_02400 [Candidatus Aenigmatarchaeota archaeon]|nr:MAG: hypothetical protein DRP10_02400 [Candidatus Aenigmarchaeota archaeon]
MAEIVVEIPELKLDRKFFEELERDINATIRLKVARELLLKEWDKRFSKSELTDEECLRLGREINKASFKHWKEMGWL